MVSKNNIAVVMATTMVKVSGDAKSRVCWLGCRGRNDSRGSTGSNNGKGNADNGVRLVVAVVGGDYGDDNGGDGGDDND